MKNLKYVLLLPLMYLTIGVMAQDTTPLNHQRQARADSLSKAEQRKNDDNLSDLKAMKNDTQAKAKDAEKVQRDATSAAKESKMAYRTEQKAQKARKRADKQAKRAAKAQAKSNNN